MAPVRLSLSVSARVRNQLEALVELSDSPSMTAVIRDALALYEDVVRHARQGGKISFEYPNGDREVLRLRRFSDPEA